MSAFDHEKAVAELPEGSRVFYENMGGVQRWHVFRGTGSTQHGDGKTLERAFQMIGAKMEPNEDGKMVLTGADGQALSPEVEVPAPAPEPTGEAENPPAGES